MTPSETLFIFSFFLCGAHSCLLTVALAKVSLPSCLAVVHLTKAEALAKVGRNAGIPFRTPLQKGSFLYFITNSADYAKNPAPG